MDAVSHVTRLLQCVPPDAARPPWAPVRTEPKQTQYVPRATRRAACLCPEAEAFSTAEDAGQVESGLQVAHDPPLRAPHAPPLSGGSIIFASQMQDPVDNVEKRFVPDAFTIRVGRRHGYLQGHVNLSDDARFCSARDRGPEVEGQDISRGVASQEPGIQISDLAVADEDDMQGWLERPDPIMCLFQSARPHRATNRPQEEPPVL